MTKLAKLSQRIPTLDTRRATSPSVSRTDLGWALVQARRRMADKADYLCQVCGRVTAMRDGELDHIVPLHLGGSDSDNNRQWLCVPCHRLKSEQEEKERMG